MISIGASHLEHAALLSLYTGSHWFQPSKLQDHIYDADTYIHIVRGKITEGDE